MLRRPRTLVMLGLFALIPVLIAIGVTVADRRAGPGRGLIGAVAGNGLVLPIAAMTVSLALLLPLAVAMAAADAIAGEAASGTLRGLLLAPVGRLRLVGMKAFGVLVVAVAAVLALAVVGVLAGLLVVGGADGQLVTLSGTTLGLGEALGRVALVVVWTVGQLAAVGAVALAVSAWTEHPLVVLAAVLGGLIVFGVLGAIPALGLAAALPADVGLVGRGRRAARPAAARRDARRDVAGAVLPRGRCCGDDRADAAPRRLSAAPTGASGFLKTRSGARMSPCPHSSTTPRSTRR